LGVCGSIALFGVRTLSQTPGSSQTPKPFDAEQWQTMSEQEKKRDFEKRHRQLELERAKKDKEVAKVGRGPLIDPKQRRKKLHDEFVEMIKEFLQEKAALEPTEEQWKLIKPKLEKLRQLREQANSKVGLGLAGGSTDTGRRPTSAARTPVPTWQWKDPWKGKASGELSEAQRIAKQLITLVERENVAPGTLKRTMEALRKARRNEAETEKQLAEARNELREVLTTRQEAALVLMNRL
jgi:hypothetical protein